MHAGDPASKARQRRLVKGLFALLVGVPGSVAFAPFIVLTFGALFYTLAVDSAPLTTARIGWNIGLMLWGSAGMAGLIGFWLWVALRVDVGMRARQRIAGLLGLGLLALVPLFWMTDSGLFLTLIAVGCAVGSLLCTWLLRPQTLLNPDRID